MSRADDATLRSRSKEIKAHPLLMKISQPFNNAGHIEAGRGNLKAAGMPMERKEEA